VKGKDLIYFDSKDRVSYNISDVNCEKNIEKVSYLSSPAHKLQQIDGRQEGSKGSDLSQKNQRRNCNTDCKDKTIVYLFATVAVVKIALSYSFQIID